MVASESGRKGRLSGEWFVGDYVLMNRLGVKSCPRSRVLGLGVCVCAFN